LEGKPNAALETNSAPAEEANKAWLTERALGSSGDATGHVVLEGSGGSPPKSPTTKGFLTVGEIIQPLEVAMRSLFTHASQEHKIGHPTQWQAQLAPSRRDLAYSFILLCCVVVVGSVCMAVVVALTSGHEVTYIADPDYPPLIAAINYNPGGDTTTVLTLLVLISLLSPALLLYGMGSGASRQALVVCGRILFGGNGQSPGLDEYMKMWVFSMKSLRRPRLAPGHRRVEWKCVSVAGLSDLADPAHRVRNVVAFCMATLMIQILKRSKPLKGHCCRHTLLRRPPWKQNLQRAASRYLLQYTWGPLEAQNKAFGTGPPVYLQTMI
jgi:hypothetical protein